MLKLKRDDIKRIFRIGETTLLKWEDKGIINPVHTDKGYKKFNLEEIRAIRIAFNKENKRSFKARVLTMSTIKGGAGKTTLTMLIASAFRMMGYKVLIIDLDKQGNISDYFIGSPAVIGEPSTIDITRGKDLTDVIYSTRFGIDIVPSNIELAEIESRQTGDLVAEFRPFVDSQRSNYDYIFIDTPTAKLPVDLALNCSDHVFSVLDPDSWAVDASKFIMDWTMKVNEVYGRNVSVLGLAFNMFKKSNVVDQVMWEAVENGVVHNYTRRGEVYSDVIKVFKTKIREAQALKHLKMKGQFIFDPKINSYSDEETPVDERVRIDKAILMEILNLAIEIRNSMEVDNA